MLHVKAALRAEIRRLEEYLKFETNYLIKNDIDMQIEEFKQAIELVNNLDIPIVSQRSGLLKAEDKDVPFDDYVKRFFKIPKMELIYRSKRNNSMMTESQLIKYYKRAMCL